MRSIVQSIMLFTMLLFAGSTFAQQNVFKMQIKENKAEAVGVGKMSTYLVKYYNSRDWEHFYAGLTNFDYEEGYRYRVLVKRTKLENVPADAPSYSYEVLKVLQKRPMQQHVGGKHGKHRGKAGRHAGDLNEMSRYRGEFNGTNGRNQDVKGSVMEIVVKENRVDCIGVGPMKCMLVKFPGKQEWENFYSGIENFQYEEGYRYTLKIRVSDRENVPADASSKRYELLKIVRKEKVAVNQALTFLGKHNWKLIQLNGKNLAENPVFMAFEAASNRVNGNAGCNSFFGTVALEGDKAIFSQIGSTEMACPHGQLEAEFLSLLANKDLRFDIAEQTFNLYKENKLVAIFGMAPKTK